MWAIARRGGKEYCETPISLRCLWSCESAASFEIVYYSVLCCKCLGWFVGFAFGDFGVLLVGVIILVVDLCPLVNIMFLVVTSRDIDAFLNQIQWHGIQSFTERHAATCHQTHVFLSSQFPRPSSPPFPFFLTAPSSSPSLCIPPCCT